MGEQRKKSVRKVRVAHELPKRRRIAIEEAMKAHQPEDRPEWDRTSEWSDIRFHRKRIKPGTLRTIHLPLLDVNLGDRWPVPVTVIHGGRPGPCITVLGGIHGDELTGPSACTHLLSNAFTDSGKPLDPATLAGTLRIVPVVNLPGYRMKSRYFPDGRDLNRQFPGDPGGSTTKRVADQIWNYLVTDSDAIIDLHSAAKGRTNMPQVRVDLSHTSSYLLAKSFGIEILLDSIPPKGTLRRTANAADIPVITYEGGGADFLGDQSVKVAVHGILNSLRSMRMIPGNPQRPKFRIMASGSTWLRAAEGGLLDMFVSAGSVMREGEVVATISDPATPGMTVDIVAPEDGLIIGAATNPFTAAGMPVGHFLPISKHFALLEEQIDANGHFIVNGSLEERVWREEHEINEISLHGAWSGEDVDSEWVDSKITNEKEFEEEEAA
jgi:predicted deacylase